MLNLHPGSPDSSFRVQGSSGVFVAVDFHIDINVSACSYKSKSYKIFLTDGFHFLESKKRERDREKKQDQPEARSCLIRVATQR